MVQFDWLKALGPVSWKQLMMQFDWFIALGLVWSEWLMERFDWLIASAASSLSLSLSLSPFCLRSGQWRRSRSRLTISENCKNCQIKILAFCISKTTKLYIFGYNYSWNSGNSVTSLPVKSEIKNNQISAIKTKILEFRVLRVYLCVIMSALCQDKALQIWQVSFKLRNSDNLWLNFLSI